MQKFKPCGLSASTFLPAYGLAENTLIVTSNRERKEANVVFVDVDKLENEVSLNLNNYVYDPS